MTPPPLPLHPPHRNVSVVSAYQHGLTVVLLIPNEKRVVGIVVGRHGLRLKTILAVSHCIITVEK